MSSIITWLISSQRQLLYGVGLCSNRHRADLEVSLQYQIHRTAITYEIYKFFYSLLFSKFMYNSCYITCSSLWFFFYTVKGKNNVCIFNPFKFMLACKLYCHVISEFLVCIFLMDLMDLFLLVPEVVDVTILFFFFIFFKGESRWFNVWL